MGSCPFIGLRLEICHCCTQLLHRTARCLTSQAVRRMDRPVRHARQQLVSNHLAVCKQGQAYVSQQCTQPVKKQIRNCMTCLLLDLHLANLTVPAGKQPPQLFCFALPPPPVLLGTSCTHLRPSGMFCKPCLCLRQHILQACNLQPSRLPTDDCSCEAGAHALYTKLTMCLSEQP